MMGEHRSGRSWEHDGWSAPTFGQFVVRGVDAVGEWFKFPDRAFDALVERVAGLDDLQGPQECRDHLAVGAHDRLDAAGDEASNEFRGGSWIVGKELTACEEIEFEAMS